MNYAKCSEMFDLTNAHLYFIVRIGVSHFTSSTERYVKAKQTNNFVIVN